MKYSFSIFTRRMEKLVGKWRKKTEIYTDIIKKDKKYASISHVSQFLYYASTNFHFNKINLSHKLRFSHIFMIFSSPNLVNNGTDFPFNFS